MTRVGFAGLGRMGLPMASNVARAGFPLAVWNRSTEPTRTLASEVGATVCATPRELARGCDVVITMLADDAASTDVHLGPDGLLSGTGGATHVVEMGTHSPDHIHRMAAAAHDRLVIDAPVSGSIDAAREARLMIMVGATDGTIDTIRPVLESMGRDVICFGDRGAGATMKLAINMLIHGLNQTLAEALTLAEASGITAERAYGAMERSAAAAPMLTYRKPQYLHGSDSPVSFALSLARKDVELALDLAAEVGIPMPQTRVNLDQLAAAEHAGFGERDMAAIIDYLRGEA